MSGRIYQNVVLQLKENTDRTIGVIDGEGVVIACSELSLIGQRWTEYVPVVNNAGGALAPEMRTLSLYEGQTLAEALVAALLEGPESRELFRAIPEGFAVNYVRVDNGICHVSLPSASLELLPENL